MMNVRLTAVARIAQSSNHTLRVMYILEMNRSAIMGNVKEEMIIDALIDR
jgi:hypothetical protein